MWWHLLAYDFLNTSSGHFSGQLFQSYLSVGVDDVVTYKPLHFAPVYYTMHSFKLANDFFSTKNVFKPETSKMAIITLLENLLLLILLLLLFM